MTRIEIRRTLTQRAFFVLVALCVFAPRAALRAETPSEPQERGGVVRSLVPRLDLESPETSAEKAKNSKHDRSDYDELLAKNSRGVQTRYPAIVKVVGRSPMKENDEGRTMVPLFYGSGVYVAEYESWGIVITNWHVVSEATESLEVRFPSGSEPSRILLRDVKWDLAALLIKKPQGVNPMPLTLAVPKVGETLWTAGYGPSSGLNDFQIQSGVLANYVSLDIPLEDLPEEAREQYEQKQVEDKDAPRSPLYETASIKVGVRRGDSGGPVLNRYGEVAGILWGSDGESTMCTSSVRVQAFTTQAVRFAARLRANKTLDSRATGESIDDIVPQDYTPECPEAFLTELPMIDAVRYEGVFPASTSPVYAPGNGVDSARALFDLDQTAAIKHVQIVANDYWKARKTGLPPSPPIFSPTFVVQQRQVRSERPELINEKTFEKLNSATMAAVQKERTLINSSSEMLIADYPGMKAQLARSSMITEPQILEASGGSRSIFSKESDEPDVAPLANAPTNDFLAKSNVAKKETAHAPKRFTKLQAYGIICALFCLFYFSVRSMRLGVEK